MRQFGGIAAVAVAAGPLIGGLITTAISWRAAFVFQAAVVVIILFALGGAVRDMFSESCQTIDDKVAPTAQCSP